MCLQYSNAPMFAQIFSGILHVPICILFIHKLEYGIEGIAYASLITYSSMFVFVTIFSHCLEDLKEALFWPTRDTFIGWGQYFKIGLPSVIMLCAESWAFQIMVVFAGLISVND